MVFFRRFIGALALDSMAFEDIEADRRAAMQSVLVVMLACAAAGVGALGLGVAGPAGFVTGMILALGAWLVWITFVAAIGTLTLPEPQTSSTLPELLRTLGFAAAPGVFLAFAALPSAAPLVIGVVIVWMIAADVIAMRQALDYRSTARAIAVAVSSWLLAVTLIAGMAAFLATRVS